MQNDTEQFDLDIVTYFGVKYNEDYASKLKQAYNFLKSMAIGKDYQQFQIYKTERAKLRMPLHKELGYFRYDEMTIYDRIEDQEYLLRLENIVRRAYALISNHNLGSILASFSVKNKLQTKRFQGDVQQFDLDVATYLGIKYNEDYATRLKEAYNLLKSMCMGKKDRQFQIYKSEQSRFGYFRYDEITIFDRIEDPEYLLRLERIARGSDAIITNPNLGTILAGSSDENESPQR